MRVKDLIQNLKKWHDPEEHLIIAYWEQSAFEVEDEDWVGTSDLVESKMDWSNAHDDINTFIECEKEDGWMPKTELED